MLSNNFKSFFTQLHANQPDLHQNLIKKAYFFSEIAHRDQKRYSGEPYFNHAKAVALILAEWHLYTPSIVAGLLHDTVEDGDATYEQIKREFGENIAEIVEGVTKISDIKLRGSTDEQFVENLRKMIVAMSKDLRVVLVKLADRLHNIRTLQYVPQEKQKRIAKETIEIYAPLADRLQMGKVKTELEDVSFPYVYPEDYQWLVQISKPHYIKAEKVISKAQKKLQIALKQANIKAQTHGRKKGLYSLYKKLLRQDIEKEIDKVHDLVAMRVIVDTILHCYTALGIVHKLWKPIPKLGISDFIAQPKPNGYQSIHTKVFINNYMGEIQIRTYKMHEQAEFGMASHISYAQAKNRGISDQRLEQGLVFGDESKLAWVKELVNLHQEIKDNKQLASELKLDALSNRIFVFTPQGDVIDLPNEATPIDFAYHIHTHLGHQATGAKINGKLVSLDYRLHSGDVCEIVKSKADKKPNRDWLNFIVTNLAKTQIKKKLREQDDH